MRYAELKYAYKDKLGDLRLSVVMTCVSPSRWGVLDLAAWPQDEHAPLIHIIEERSSEKASLHLNQLMILLYGWSTFIVSSDANLL